MWMIWQRSDDWIGSEIDESFVMVNIDSGNYVSLNVTANAVWKALESPSSEEDIVRDLTGQFDIDPEQCRNSVSLLLNKMSEMALVKPA
jgi:Coenzyme PQQ synthesis protein D (PqqD)